MLNLVETLSISEPKCELFGVLGITIQALLGFLSFSTLIIKRYREKKRRPWLIWGMDTSKQAFGACYQHILNLWVAVWLGGLNDSPCKWYFLNYLMDIFFGTILNYSFFMGIEKFCSLHNVLKFKSGVYSNKDDPTKPVFNKWIYQFIIWILVLTTAKFFVILASCLGKDGLDVFGDIILTPLRINVHFELVMIMVVLPFLMNAAQFWVQDNFLKKQGKPHEKMVEVIDFNSLLKVKLLKEVKKNEKVDDLNSTFCSNVSDF